LDLFGAKLLILLWITMQFNKTLDRAVNVFRETGSVLRKPGSGGIRKRTDEIVANAQEIMENTPKTLNPTIKSAN
jgi:hypothetical protein